MRHSADIRAALAASLPDLDGTLELRGLEDRVEVYRDTLGIPHVRGRTTHDAFFAQGFVHAQERLWQMEQDRRRAAGRLAECLGPSVLASDVLARRLGLAASARADYETFDSRTRDALDAYARGVNAFLERGVLAAEMRLLDLSPDPWQPWDCGAVLKVRHLFMGSMDPKLWRTRLIRTLGRDAVRLAASANGADALVIVPVGGRARVNVSAEELEPSALALAELATGATPDGSNAWVVHGTRTASGLPLLAGDPHRPLEVPNVYCQQHIAGPDFDVIGLSIPGVPGMPHFGHNNACAWGITHAVADTQDLWVERFDEHGHSFYRGQWRAVERRVESVGVRDGAPVEVPVVRTHHGPVVVGDPATGAAVTMRWTATDKPDTTLAAIVSMLDADSVEELDERMRPWVEPCNSLLMADRHGTIGYLFRGRAPVRSRSHAWAPVPGWDGRHEWEGDVPFDELPRMRNPTACMIVSANNRICADDYPHYLGTDFAGPSRAQRILDRLGALERATAADMAALHADCVALPARRFVQAVAQLKGLSPRADEARRALAAWDGRMHADAVAPTLYAALRQSLAELLCERGPLAEVAPPFPEEPQPVPNAARVRRALPRLLADPDASLLGAAHDVVLAEALERAVASLAKQLHGGLDTWSYARVHTTRIRHPLSASFPQAAPLLDPPQVGMGGDADTVLCSTAQLGLGIERASVARYVFDLADWDRSTWIVPLGASGHATSPHYADQARDWSAVRLQPMIYSWERVTAQARMLQHLAPKTSPSDPEESTP